MKLKLMDDNILYGKEEHIIALSELTRWSQTTSDITQKHILEYTVSDADPRHERSPFASDEQLNKKIILWNGDITQLQVDAIVNSTNESLNDTNPVSDKIYAKAGPQLKDELINDVRECRTGEVRLSYGYMLPAKYILHTVGPKYHIKYKTAAENSLHMCYRNVMQKAIEMNFRSVALTAIHSVKKGYPSEEGVHIALRTIRRFLDMHHNYFDTIVIHVCDSVDMQIYKLIMPWYFPRTVWEEEIARWQLPNDLGGKFGEPQNHDRQIRIIDNPQHIHNKTTSSVDLTDESDLVVNIGELSFSHMHGDLDQERLLGGRAGVYDPLSEIMVKELQHHERYEQLLRRAKNEDLSEVSGIGCLYQSGVDRLGRPVVVFVGKWFPFSKINLDKALLYLIYLLDPIVRGDYVIAYFHTLTSHSNYPSFSWLREVYNVLPYKYKKNLKAFYIVHPTFWTKMTTWWFTTFMAPAIKQKVHSLPGVEYLYAAMSPDQLEIPAYITEYDMSINGVHYFRPEPVSTT